ncbi:MAG: hypothetical protein HY308_04730 [Gammaproteobacteria bacterium]|nr:hypothetical protein [Gammaproteobacteria bacterium]
MLLVRQKNKSFPFTFSNYLLALHPDPGIAITDLCSDAWVWTSRKWCGDGEWRIQNDPPNDCAGIYETKWLAPWDNTPPDQDWDTFRVDPGWEYGFASTWDGTDIVDRRWQGEGEWVRVHDYETMIVYWQCSESGACY